MAKKQSKRKRKQSSSHRYFIIIGIVILAGAIFLLKDKPQAPGPVSSNPLAAILPEAQLEQALAAGQPVLAFFHSYTCYQCERMMEIVDDVYPDFSGAVTLVDVDVYDRDNIDLLRAARIQVIPTVILFNRAGEAQVFVGVMEPEQLRQELSLLSGR